MPLLPIISADQARTILEAKDQSEIKLTLDLGLTKTTIPISKDGLVFPEATIPWKAIKKLLKSERRCFNVTPDGLIPVKVHSTTTGWVRTLASTQGAPTTLVSGYPMHRIKNTDPWADTLAKLEACIPVKGHVLDTCTGLGYTAILAARQGATSVTTIELDPAAITIAEQNPWSQDLFTNKKITQIIGDAVSEIENLPSNHFSLVIHDPPTIQFAGELYSEDFYRQLKRILTPKGRLFHYIGSPDSKIGHSMTEGTIKRFHNASFQKITRKPDAFGILAQK